MSQHPNQETVVRVAQMKEYLLCALSSSPNTTKKGKRSCQIVLKKKKKPREG
jgi:hypothetical protein